MRNPGFKRDATDWIPSGNTWRIVQGATLLAADAPDVPTEETNGGDNPGQEEEASPPDDFTPVEMSNPFFLPLLMNDSNQARP